MQLEVMLIALTSPLKRIIKVAPDVSENGINSKSSLYDIKRFQEVT
jgi:hypothetical protein